VTDSFEPSIEKWNLHTAEKGDWKLEVWTTSRVYYSSSPISLGVTTEDRRNGDFPPIAQMVLRLRQANDPAVLNESRPAVKFFRRGKEWYAEVRDVFGPNRIMPAGEYLLEIHVILPEIELTANDVPITIRKVERGY
jgi:hypothetical protein